MRGYFIIAEGWPYKGVWGFGGGAHAVFKIKKIKTKEHNLDKT